MSHLDSTPLDSNFIAEISNGSYKGSYADILKVRESLTDQLRVIDVSLFHNVDLEIPGYSVIVFPSDLEPQGRPFMKACLMYHDEPCNTPAHDLPVNVLTCYTLIKIRLVSWIEGELPSLSFEGVFEGYKATATEATNAE
jgi:hypothetical protein